MHKTNSSKFIVFIVIICPLLMTSSKALSDSWLKTAFTSFLLIHTSVSQMRPVSFYAMRNNSNSTMTSLRIGYLADQFLGNNFGAIKLAMEEAQRVGLFTGNNVRY